MPNINTRFTLAGEKEYTAAISKIGNSMRVLNSEMRKVESAYAKDKDSIEALTAKNDVLSGKIEKQKETIELMRQALEKAQQAQETANEKLQKAKGVLDESSDKYQRLAQGAETAAKRTQDWQVKLNNAEAKLNDYNNKLEENSEKIEKANKKSGGFQSTLERVREAIAKAEEAGSGLGGVLDNLKESFSDDEKASVGLGDAVNTVADKLGIKLPEEVEKGLEALNGIDAGTATSVGCFAALAAAITKAEKKLIDLTKEAAEDAKDIQTLGSITGQSAQDVQKMQYAAGKLGVSYDRIRDSLKEVTNKMQDAQNGSEDTAKAFETLGVKITDGNGNLRSSEDVFLDILEALGNMENQSERDALAMDLMSESAQELNPLIGTGSGKLRDYMQAAEDMGLVLEEDELAALTKVQEAFYDMEAQQKATKDQLAVEFAPYLEEFYGRVTGIIKDVGDAIEKSGIVDAAGMLLNTVVNIIDPMAELSNDRVPKLTRALEPLAKTLAIMADAVELLRGVINFGTGHIGEGWGQMKHALGFESGNPNNLQKLYDKWDEMDAQTVSSASSGRSGFGGGVATQSVVNNYYEVSGANVRAVNQIADAAESSRQQNRKFGG